MEPRTAFERLKALQVVDVRQYREFEAGRIEGAMNVPLDELADRLHEIDSGRPVLTVCRTGSRSERAAELLRSRGFETHDLEGGMKAWDRSGLPYSTATGEPGSVVAQPDAPPRASDDISDSETDPALVELQNDLIQVSYAFNERFGDREPTEQEEREFMLEWLVGKGKTEAEAKAFLDS